ncbi:MAG: CPBP family intramembrane glutamic endopeptidase [Blastochloris sp.]|nr:CPBP family intramembrane glutamic endopeptidase [Blastochloris sp.]
MRRVLLGLLFFFGGIVLLSALVTPWAYAVVEYFAAGQVPFRRVFNRALMISALVLLWPLARFWGIRTWKEVGMHKVTELKGDVLWWLALGLLSVGGLFVVQLLSGDRVWGWRGDGVFFRLLGFGLSAGLIGFLEEILFRGVLFLALLKIVPQRPVWVAVLTSFFFSTTHYLKAVNPAGEIGWLSGFESWGLMLGELGNMEMLALRWVSLFLVGVVLCALAYKKETLWGCMGLHAGWVLGLKTFNQATDWRGGEGSWWFQPDILSGLAAELMLIGMLVGVLLWSVRRDQKSVKFS